MATSTSLLPIHFPSKFNNNNNRRIKHKPISIYQHESRYPTLISASSSSPSPSNSSWWEKEEQRWIREEQRWIREEQRWLREESRWSAERQVLLNEIAALRARIAALELSTTSGGALLGGPVAAVGQLPPAAEVEESEVLKKVVIEEVSAASGVVAVEKEEEGRKKMRRTLRKGSEGEDVKDMQEALLSLGFYSGEEDMEYSSFSSGTERAVKTWQASLGTTQDGIMTVELFERLLKEINNPEANVNTDKAHVNGVPVASVTEITEIEQTFTKESNDAEVQVSQHRVFLLGENRWEEPSRLKDKDKPISKSKTATKCLSCRGEGRLMCTECDGTGEPNIEPQFLEWVDEGAKCPYCEGLGYTVCNVCEGKTVVEA